MTSPGSDALRDDLARLERCLLGAVRELSGPAAHDLIVSLRDDAIALRAGTLAGGRDGFAARFGGLADGDLERVASAFTQWCHLMNVAEEQHRIRALRARGERPSDGLAAAVAAMHDAGMGADEV